MVLRAAIGVVALLAGGCERLGQKPKAPVSGLRVPLPDGWRASQSPNGLQVGPEGHIVLELENSTSRPFPEGDALLTAIEANGVEVLEKDAKDGFVGVRYSFTGARERREAFLGVRRVGERVVWCSTTGSARPEEVQAAMTVCSDLSWDG